MFLKIYYTSLKMFTYLSTYLPALKTQQYNAHFLKIVTLVKSDLFKTLKIHQKSNFIQITPKKLSENTHQHV